MLHMHRASLECLNTSNHDLVKVVSDIITTNELK